MFSVIRSLKSSSLQQVARNYATKTIFVGNLSNFTTPEELETTFSQYGTVTNVRRPNARYGFVEMEEEEALEAVKNLDGFVHSDREWSVKISTGASKPNTSSWSGKSQ
ncbi:hypothetical protein K7432_012562 [Basidiobolus ranarum]|uniref:RRM domain-containing protein n=1 Tax=Basidiobolus ranarum TaxID=34480 RepID=A0ABR2WKN2_9FUNG